ncbi:reverse transcriptase domain-containing protein [Tanacetum coccineum]
MKFPNVPNTSVKLMLFPFSLEGAARIWLEKEPPRSIETWDDLVSKFINKFFPPSKTTNLRNEITRFQQKFDETFYEAWDRFNDLLRGCPHHGFSELHQLDTFYNALNSNDQDSLNSAAGGDTKNFSYNARESVNKVNLIDIACEEYSQEFLGFSEELMMPNVIPEKDILLLEAILNSEPLSPLPNHANYFSEIRKELKICETKTDETSVDESPKIELKDLPPHLEYAFLEGDNKLPVIIAKNLSVGEKAALIKVLQSHKRAIAWKLSDIKGINPEFCTHKILMEEDYTPAGSNIREVPGYGYIKTHKKTVKKNEQARTRESKEYKKKPKNQSRSQKVKDRNQIQSTSVNHYKTKPHNNPIPVLQLSQKAKNDPSSLNGP